MKSFILKWILALMILIPCNGALAALLSRGLVIYSDIPNTFAETLEFVTITSTNAVIATVVLPNGKRQEIARAGIIAIVNYPPDLQTESLPQQAEKALSTIQVLRPKYPQFSAKLGDIQTLWNNSLEVYRRRQLSAKATPLKSAPALTLEVDGTKYSQVEMTSFDGATVGIAHSAGVAGIPAIKLKPEQIAALNATSSSIRIDPTKIVVATPPPSPKSIGTGPVQKRTTLSLKQLKEDRAVIPAMAADPAWAPAYQETLDFINSKLKATGRRIWFGDRTQKMILQTGGEFAVFDPVSCSPVVHYESKEKEREFARYPGGAGSPPKMDKRTVQVSHLQIDASGGSDGVQFFFPNGKMSKSDRLFLNWENSIDPSDIERLAHAFSHLIEMCGGKPSAF